MNKILLNVFYFFLFCLVVCRSSGAESISNNFVKKQNKNLFYYNEGLKVPVEENWNTLMAKPKNDNLILNFDVYKDWGYRIIRVCKIFCVNGLK